MLTLTSTKNLAAYAPQTAILKSELSLGLR